MDEFLGLNWIGTVVREEAEERDWDLGYMYHGNFWVWDFYASITMD